MSFRSRLRRGINREALFINIEFEPKRLEAQAAVLETLFAQLQRNSVQDFHIVLEINSVVLRSDGYSAQSLSIDNILRICVSEARARSTKSISRNPITRVWYNLLDDGLSEPSILESTILRHSENDRECQPFDTRKQTANLLAKSRR